MSAERKKGSTSITEYFYLVERTAGTAKTGVAAGNLYLAYTRSRESAVASVCASLTSSAAAFSSYGALEVDATNAPGLYRVDAPNAAYSNNANVDSVIFTLIATSTASVAPAMKEVLLVDNTPSDNYSLISAGVKASTVIGNVGGSVGSVVGNVGGSVGSVVGGVGATVTVGTVASVSGNVGGSVGSVVGNVGGSVGSVVGGVGATVTVGTVASVSGNVGGSVGSVVGNVGGSVGSVVGGVGATVTVGTVASVSGNVGGSVGSVVGNVGGSVGSVVGGVGATVTVGSVTVGTNNDKTGYALSATGSAALTEDYPTDGSTGTLNQMLYAIMQGLSDFSITASTRTVLKLDGTTTAMQYSFNSDTSPTAQTRFA